MGEMWPLAYLIGAVEHISSSPSLEPGGKNLTVCQYQVILSRPAHPRALQITHWCTFFFFFWTRPGPKGLQHTCEYRVCVVIVCKISDRKKKTKKPAETPQTLKLETRHLKGSNRMQHLHIWYNNAFLWRCWPFHVALGSLRHRL